MVFWPNMGRLSVRCVAVMYAMVGTGETWGPLKEGVVMRRSEGPGVFFSGSTLSETIVGRKM